MKKLSLFSLLLAVILSLCVAFAGCGNNDKQTPDDSDVNTGATQGSEGNIPKDDEDKVQSGGRILVAYFSRADENYSVGYIEKGNTEIIAEIISEEVGGDLFHIERNTPYPAGYEDCKTVATAEKNSNARPALKEDKDISVYDIIFIGYPIWWGDAPMPVYTFAENKDWTGKTVIPFSTHEGSGLGSGESNLKKICSGAEFKTGLAIRGATAQNSTATAKTQVLSWLNNLGF